jgi:hypothetical protein
MSLSDFSEVVVSVDAAGLKQRGFGTILVAAYHSYWLELTRTVSELSELTTAGVPTKHPIYRMCQMAFAQNPRVAEVKVGRLTTAYTQVIKITPVYVAGATYKITIETLTGAKTEVTAAAGADLDATCDNLVTAITALGYGEIAAAPSGATATFLTITSDAGEICYVSAWDPALLKVEDTTPDPGIAGDLDDIVLYDADWYGLALDLNARAIIEEAADWLETRTALFGANTSDWQAVDPASSADIFSILQDKSYERDAILFKQNATDQYSGLGWLAAMFPFDPGVIGGEAGGTFNAKTIAGATPDTLSPTAQGALEDKNANMYVTTAGVNHTLGGKTPGGEWIDVTRGIDWYRVRMSEDLAGLQLGNRRIPYTDPGIARVINVVEARNKSAVNAGLFSADPAPAVSAPTAAEAELVDKANRIFRGVKVTATLQGAIHKTIINVNVSV